MKSFITMTTIVASLMLGGMAWADDCNGNGVPDDFEIESWMAADCNGNGIPDSCDALNGDDEDLDGVIDSCQCLADIAAPDEPGIQDGLVNVDDLLCVLGYWGSTIETADINNDGLVAIDDLLMVLDEWGVCRGKCCVGVLISLDRTCHYLSEEICSYLDWQNDFQTFFGDPGSTCTVDSSLLFGGDDVPPGDGGGGGGVGGSITIPSGNDPCDYICSLEKDDPCSWPLEFCNVPPDIIRDIWDILIEGLLDSYGCDPCDGGGDGALGACCDTTTGNCLDTTEDECVSGFTWLGPGTTCIVDCP